MTNRKPLPRIYKTDLPVTVGVFHACQTDDHARCLVYVHRFNQHAECSCPCHPPELVAEKKRQYEGATYYGDES